MNKIESLTPEQQQQLIADRETYQRLGLTTERAPRVEVEQAVAAIRAYLGSPCDRVWWFDGPATANIAVHLMSMCADNLGANLRDNLRDNLWDNLWHNLRDNLRDNLWHNLWHNLWANLGANLRDNLRDSLGANLWANLLDSLGANLWANLLDSLGANLGANLGDNLLDSLGDNLRDNLWHNLLDNLRDNLWANLRDSLGANLGDMKINDAFYGSLEIYWISYYLWPHDALRPMHTADQIAQLTHWKTLAKAGWWMPFEHINIVCELPSEIHRQDGLLHNDKGPAVVFRDGWLHWSLSGITVDEQVVMSPETQTIEQIRADDNEERRRIRIERFGWGRYLESINAKVIDLRRNDVEGTDEGLMCADGITVLVCACPSTGRVYGMEVENGIETCDAAQRWLRNFDGNCIGAS